MALSRRTFHYQKRIWTNICKVDVLRSGIGPILIIMGFVGNEFGPKLNNMGIIEHGFVTKFNKVGTIGYPNPTKRVPSMQHLIENSSKWALSEPKLNPNLTKWKIRPREDYRGWIVPKGGFGPKSGHSVWEWCRFSKKVVILCGSGESRCHHSRTIWPLF